MPNRLDASPHDEPTRIVGRFEWERAVRERFKRADLCILLDLGTFMDADGGGARPPVSRLAASTGYSEGQVRRSLTSAIEDHFLERTRRGHRLGNGRAMASEYRAVLPASTAHPCAVDSTPEETSTAQARAVEHASTAQNDGLNRASGPSQPRTGARPPRHLHHDTPTTGAPELRERAEAIVASEVAAGKKIGNRSRYVDAVEERLRTEAVELERSARRYDHDRSCPTCTGTGWGIIPDDAPPGTPPPRCPDCQTAVAS